MIITIILSEMGKLKIWAAEVLNKLFAGG